jgi:glycosyltransferase involved in cell wall biosynthesis
MALGTPVVSTAKGAEGLDVVHGKNIMIADEPDEIASSVVRILRDSKLRERLSTEGRNLILEKYSSEVMGRKFNSLLDFVVTAYGSK